MSTSRIQTSLRRSYTILADKVYLSGNISKTKQNINALVFGSERSDKTDLILANLLQASGSYVVYDPEGALYEAVSGFLERRGYRALGVDLASPGRFKAVYNPFHYTASVSAQNRVSGLLKRFGMDYAEQWQMKSDTLGLESIPLTKTAIFAIADPSNPEALALCSLLIEHAIKETLTSITHPLHTRFLLDSCTNLDTLPYLAGHSGFLRRHNASCICTAESPAALESAIGPEEFMFFLNHCDSQVYFSDDSGVLAAALEGTTASNLADIVASLRGGQCLVCISGESPVSVAAFRSKSHPNFRRAVSAGKGCNRS